MLVRAMRSCILNHAGTFHNAVSPRIITPISRLAYISARGGTHLLDFVGQTFYTVGRCRPLGAARAAPSAALPGRVAQMTAWPAHAVRRVMHCDLDCFFAAVE